jgi:hyaluronoglucosaminidase
VLNGVIEGFYGRPWSWDERVEVMRAVAPEGLPCWVHAPKDDPLHRERWRDPWTDDHLDGFARLAAEPHVRAGIGISPGLSMAYDDGDDRAALAAKVDGALAAGCDLVVLCVDDIPVRPGLGPEHAALTTWLHEHLDGRAELALVPTEYTGTRSTPYLDALAEGVPADVPIGWTGDTVVCDSITVAEARARAASLGDRPPLVWDNVPVNDGFMADRLLLGPLRGREPGLPAVCSGWLANPMVQPRSSVLPLRSIAAFVRGDDPQLAWEAAAGDLRPLAEACDGEVPRRLVAALVAGTDPEPLRRWLVSVAECTVGELGDEAEPWAEQARAEAKLGLSALKLLAAVEAGEQADPATSMRAMGIGARWPAVRRAEVSVMGPRCSFRPVMAQDDAGEWVMRPEAIQDDQNAIDTLVRHALARYTDR